MASPHLYEPARFRVRAMALVISALLCAAPSTALADIPSAVVTATVATTTAPQTLTVSSVFSGATMSTSTNPIISFTPSIYGDLATTSAAWSPDGTTYTETYDIATGTQATNVVATVSGAEDVDLPADIAADATSTPFSYDTVYWTIAATSSANGSISPSGSVSVHDGDSQSFAFSPLPGYRVAGLSIDGGSLVPTATTSYQFPSVNGNHSISVSFAPYGSVTSLPVLVNLSTDNILTVTTVFSQEMSSTTLAVDFAINGTPIAGGDLVPLSAGWSVGTTTYTASFSAAAGLTLSNVVTTVSGASDALGASVNALSSNAFSIDTVLPNGSTATLPATLVNVASSTVTVATDFDKAMASTTPSVRFFDSLLGDITPSFSLQSAGWVTTTRYAAIFTALPGVNQTGVRAVTSAASDTSGNIAPAATSSPFTVDTLAPTGVAATGVSIVNVASSTVTVSTTFDKPMATSTVPFVSFTSGLTDVSGDFTASTTQWTSTTTFQAVFTANPGVYQTNVVANVFGAKDTDDNAAATSTTPAFTLDTVVPTGNVTAPSASAVVNIAHDTVTITTVFSKAMASTTLAVGFVNATSSADIGSDFTFLTGMWGVGSTTYSAIYRAASLVYEPAVIATVSGARDLDDNAAPATSTPQFLVDTIAPFGLATTPGANAVFNLASSTIMVTTTFTKPMASTTLAVNFTPSSILSFLATTTASWLSPSTYTSTFAVAPGFENTGVVATVSGATDLNGNVAAATSTPAFTVDTLAPVGSLSLPTFFTVVNVASSTVTLTTNFSKPMASTTLNFQFLSATSSDITAEFTNSGAGWTSPSTYVAAFTAVAGLFKTGVTAVVSGAVDTHGNPSASTSTPAFTVDTLAPTAAVVSSAPLVNVVNNTVTVTTTFSKAMDATVAPTIVFATPGMDISSYFTATGTPLAARWTNGTTTYSLLYTVTTPVATSSVVATVSGAVDTNQNLAAPASSAPFVVDVIAPVGSVTSPTAGAVFNVAAHTITFAALFDKPMASTSPTVTFAPTGIYGYVATSTASWVTPMLYQAVYTVAPNFNSSAVTMGISGAQDTNQNFAPATTTAPFTVDTLLPIMTVISPTASVLVNIANSTTTVVALFDKPMASTTLAFAFANASSTNLTPQFTLVTRGWTNPSSYSAVFAAAPGFGDPSVRVSVSGASDTDANPAAAATSSAFAVDMVAPSAVVSVPASVTGAPGASFSVTVSFTKPMASTTPTIVFAPNLSGSLTTVSSGWTSTTTYTYVFAVASPAQYSNVTATVSGASDTSGNSAAAATSTAFSVNVTTPVVPAPAPAPSSAPTGSLLALGPGQGSHNPLPYEVGVVQQGPITQPVQPSQPNILQQTPPPVNVAVNTPSAPHVVLSASESSATSEEGAGSSVPSVPAAPSLESASAANAPGAGTFFGGLWNLVLRFLQFVHII